MNPRIEIHAIATLPEVQPGDDLASLILEGARQAGLEIVDGDVLVVTQKIVSKSEDRIVSLSSVEPTSLARNFAQSHGKDARAVEVSLREASRVVKMDRGVLITETRHGFVCANSGVDDSNVPGAESVSLLPLEPDRSAERLRTEIERRTGVSIAVILSDTFGRPWREGVTNVAIGVSGMAPVLDYRGSADSGGKILETTMIAVADELAAAAELVMGKLDRVPVALIRGYDFSPAAGSAKALVRDPRRDLFR
jgi:coenzyme F420-0:L-glutamate ligase/coenzyme F420-1:gamma-L-glutamate ligase